MYQRMRTIIFAGGCFWCVEAVFQRLRGVVRVVSGYAGGEAETARYEKVSSGRTPHAEAVLVEYDDQKISLDDLLAVFFSSHDPTTMNRQGNDTGPQYRSAIFCFTPEQKQKAEAYIQKLEQEKVFASPIVTEILENQKFFPAETYHQNYYNQNSDQMYCQVVINPKLEKLRKQFSHLLREKGEKECNKKHVIARNESRRSRDE